MSLLLIGCAAAALKVPHGTRLHHSVGQSRSELLRSAASVAALVALPPRVLADDAELAEATFSAGDPRFMQKSFDECKYLGVKRSEIGMLGDVPAIRYGAAIHASSLTCAALASTDVAPSAPIVAESRMTRVR